MKPMVLWPDPKLNAIEYDNVIFSIRWILTKVRREFPSTSNNAKKIITKRKYNKFSNALISSRKTNANQFQINFYFCVFKTSIKTCKFKSNKTDINLRLIFQNVNYAVVIYAQFTWKLCKCNLCTFFIHILKMRILIMQMWSMQENSQTQDDSNVI